MSSITLCLPLYLCLSYIVLVSVSTTVCIYSACLFVYHCTSLQLSSTCLCVYHCICLSTCRHPISLLGLYVFLPDTWLSLFLPLCVSLPFTMALCRPPCICLPFTTCPCVYHNVSFYPLHLSVSMYTTVSLNL
jgi:hypothetical protein